MSTSLPPLILSAHLRVQGDSTRHLELGVSRGDFVRIRPGAYLPAREWAALGARSRHLVAMAAVAATSRRRLLFSGESAAALHGIPLLGGWSTRPHLVDHVDRRRAALVGVTTHRLELADDEIVEVGGVLATSPARTALDLAGTRGFLSGVVAIDHVLGRPHGVPRAAFEAWLDRAGPRRGVRRMTAALAVASGLSESPLESLSLGQFFLLGLPAPRQQVEFAVDGRTYRADFHFEDADVIGEADGRSKYGSATLGTPTPEQAVWQEKEREDSLRSIVRGFARWKWEHALQGERLRVRLQRAGVAPVR